jgi:spore coat polysaccharide biosynthesis predicted glycosyltransferase SpsG
MKRTVLFRVDGGKVFGISMGHIKRCLILAKALADTYKTVFIMKEYTDGISFVKQQGMAVESISIDDNSEDTMVELCEKHSPEKIIFDLQSNTYKTFFEYAKTKKIQSIIFDITGNYVGIPDILINDSFVKEFTLYPHLDGRTQLYMGPDYFLMEARPEFSPIRKDVADIMVTQGGSDPTGLTITILSCIKSVDFQHNVNVVLGPLFTDNRALYDVIGDDNRFHIYKNPDDFLQLVSRQDIVITAAGRTLYECGCLGRPVIVTPSIEHEAVTAKEYSRLTGCCNIGLWYASTSPSKLVNALYAYRDSFFLRNSVSEKGRKIFDGNALERIVALIN